MKLIKPKALKIGDTLGIVACSTPITASSEETIERAYQRIRDHGFSIIEAPNCRKTYGHAAGTIKDRVKALHDFFRNPKIDGILHYWGGYQSHQLLEYLDFDLIRKNPKPFIGFSDTTALQAGIFAKTGLVTFSGPVGINYGKPVVPDFTWQYFQKVLIHPEVPLELIASKDYSDNPWYLEPEKKMRFQPNPGWKVYRKGKAEGQIVGGNLGTLLLLAGTEYWPNLRGKILFVEDDESESSKTMDRMFTQLRQMGVYELISGMVVGRFHQNVKFSESDSLEMILDDALKGYKFAVLIGCSHDAVNRALRKFEMIREPSKHGRIGYEVGWSRNGRFYEKSRMKTVKWMADLRDGGISYREIARRLEKKGIPTPSGKQKWYACTVRSILNRSQKIPR